MGLKQELCRLLAEAGRTDLAQRAVGTVTFTDDGSSLYIHVLAHPQWPRVARGRAFVLAWADYAEVAPLALRKGLVRQARLALTDDLEEIMRWLDRR